MADELKLSRPWMALDTLFRQAEEDRFKAYELKRELDRLNVSKEYEDRFLNLVKNPE